MRPSWSNWPRCWRPAKRRSADRKADRLSRCRVFPARSLCRISPVRNADLVMTDQATNQPAKHPAWRVTIRTLSKAWDDSIFSESAQAAFWQVLSLPPLLLGLLGSLAYIGPLFGPDTLPAIEDRLVGGAKSFFSPSVVNEIIAPTITDIVQGARGEVVSIGFLISLWAGSSGGFGVRRLGGQGPRPDPVSPPGSAAVLFAADLRHHVGGRDRGVAADRPGAAADRQIRARRLGARACATAITPRWWSGWRSSSPCCTGLRCPRNCRRTAWSSARCLRRQCS